MTFPYTKIPNILLDTHLPSLTEAELKILLIIIRQTYGWIDKSTGTRKLRDRLSHSQFIAKTGLSRRAISIAINTLIGKSLIKISSFDGLEINDSSQRQGKTHLFYSPNLCKFITQPVQIVPSTCAESAYNKRNDTKENITKGNGLPVRQNPVKAIGEVIDQSGYRTIIWS